MIAQAARAVVETLGLGLLEELWDALVEAVHGLVESIRLAFAPIDSRLSGAAAGTDNPHRHGDITCVAR